MALGPYVVSLTVKWKGWAQGLGPLLFSLSRAHPSFTETLWTLSPHSVFTSCLGIKAPLKGTSLIIKVFLFQTLLQCGPRMLQDHSWAWGGWGWTAVFLHLQPWGLVKKKKKKASPAFHRVSLFLWRAPGWRPDKQPSHTGWQSLYDVSGWVIRRRKPLTFKRTTRSTCLYWAFLCVPEPEVTWVPRWLWERKGVWPGASLVWVTALQQRQCGCVDH